MYNSVTKMKHQIVPLWMMFALSHARTITNRMSADEFQQSFVQTQKALIDMGNKCTTDEFLDLELETCKNCETHCPDNLCGQCRVYFLQKLSDEHMRMFDARILLLENNTSGTWLWLSIGAITLVVFGTASYFAWRKCGKTKHDNYAPKRTTNRRTQHSLEGSIGVCQSTQVVDPNRVDGTTSHRQYVSAQYETQDGYEMQTATSTISSD